VPQNSLATTHEYEAGLDKKLICERRYDWPIFDFSLRFPKVVGQKGSQGPKNKDFEKKKMKKNVSRIHPIDKCAKFQHFPIFEFSRVTQIFRAKKVPRVQK